MRRVKTLRRRITIFPHNPQGYPQKRCFAQLVLPSYPHNCGYFGVNERRLCTGKRKGQKRKSTKINRTRARTAVGFREVRELAAPTKRRDRLQRDSFFVISQRCVGNGIQCEVRQFPFHKPIKCRAANHGPIVSAQGDRRKIAGYTQELRA